MGYVYDDKIEDNAVLLKDNIKTELSNAEIKDRIHEALEHIGLNISLSYKEEAVNDNTKTYAIDKEMQNEIYLGKLSMYDKIEVTFNSNSNLYKTYRRDIVILSVMAKLMKRIMSCSKRMSATEANGRKYEAIAIFSGDKPMGNKSPPLFKMKDKRVDECNYVLMCISEALKSCLPKNLQKTQEEANRLASMFLTEALK